MGFDALYRNDWTEPELVRTADAEDRVTLTRSRRVLQRRMVRQGYCVLRNLPRAQAHEVLDRFDLRASVRPWTRCLRCNGLLAPAEKQE